MHILKTIIQSKWVFLVIIYSVEIVEANANKLECKIPDILIIIISLYFTNITIFTNCLFYYLHSKS